MYPAGCDKCRYTGLCDLEWLDITIKDRTDTRLACRCPRCGRVAKFVDLRANPGIASLAPPGGYLPSPKVQPRYPHAGRTTWAPMAEEEAVDPQEDLYDFDIVDVSGSGDSLRGAPETTAGGADAAQEATEARNKPGPLQCGPENAGQVATVGSGHTIEGCTMRIYRVTLPDGSILPVAATSGGRARFQAAVQVAKAKGVEVSEVLTAMGIQPTETQVNSPEGILPTGGGVRRHMNR